MFRWAHLRKVFSAEGEVLFMQDSSFNCVDPYLSGFHFLSVPHKQALRVNQTLHFSDSKTARQALKMLYCFFLQLSTAM